MKTIEEFEAFFYNKLSKKEEFVALEERRLEVKRKKLYIIQVVAWIVLIHVILILLHLFVWWTIFITITLGPYLGYKVFHITYIDRSIQSDFKDVVISPMIRYLMPKMDYNKRGYIPILDFKESELFLMEPDHYHGDDYLEGELARVPLRMSEIHASYESSDRFYKSKENRWNTIFKGLFFIMYKNDAFQSETFLIPDKSFKNIGHLGRVLQYNNYYRGTRILINQPDIENVYTIYTDNVQDGKRILKKTQVLEFIASYSQENDVDVYAAFKGKKVYVALHFGGRDMFEINMKKSLFDFKHISRYYHDLEFALNVTRMLS